MPYIFGKLWHLAIIWAIRKAFQCILQGVRFLLAKQTRLSGTSDNMSLIYLLLCLHSPGVQRWYKDALRPIERQRFLWVPLFGLFQGNINKSRQGRRTPLPAFPVLIQKTSVHVEAIFCQLGKAHKTGFLTKYIFFLISVQPLHHRKTYRMKPQFISSFCF